MAHAPAHAEDGKDTVGSGGHRTHGDQAVHIGRTFEERAKAFGIIGPVQVHNGQNEEKFSKP